MVDVSTNNPNLTNPDAEAPARYLIVTGIIVILIAIAAFYQMTRQPWIGARFSAVDGFHGIVVKKVHAFGPASAVLTKGDRLVEISDGHLTVPLDPIILEEPNNLPTYQLFNRSLALQDDTWRILEKETVRLRTDDGEWLSIKPEESRPFSAIPAVFWFYPPIASIGVFLGALVWLRQPNTSISLFISLLGWIYYIGMCEMMLIDRELALGGNYFKILLAGENFGTNGYIAAALSILYTYPSMIIAPIQCISIFAAAILIALNSTFQWIELPIHAFLVHFLFTNSALALAVWFQWRSARYQPIAKATLLWMGLWMFITMVVALLIFLGPMIVGDTSIIPIESSRLVISSFSIGMSFIIFRYQLFNVERWWFLSLVWLLGGALVIIFDILFVIFLNLQPALAMTFSLVAAGLLYFPARQWLLTRMLPDRHGSIEDRITAVIAKLSTQHEDSSRRLGWENLLRSYFKPARMAPQPYPVTTTRLTDSGLSLLVPGDDENQGFLLSGKNFGKTLFNKEDIDLVHALHILNSMVREAKSTAEQSAKCERHRIMQDLHDTMGAQLLTLIHRSNRNEYAQKVRETLQNLRESIRILSYDHPVKLSELLTNWRVEMQDKADTNGFRLDWVYADPYHEEIVIKPHDALLFSFLARELLINFPVSIKPRAVTIKLRPYGAATRITLLILGGKETYERYRKHLVWLTNITYYAQSIGYRLATRYFGDKHDPRLVIVINPAL